MDSNEISLVYVPMLNFEKKIKNFQFFRTTTYVNIIYKICQYNTYRMSFLEQCVDISNVLTFSKHCVDIFKILIFLSKTLIW